MSSRPWLEPMVGLFPRSESTARDVMKKLLKPEIKLFDRKKGSIPMFNYLREKAVQAKNLGLGLESQTRTLDLEEPVDPRDGPQGEENLGRVGDPSTDPQSSMGDPQVPTEVTMGQERASTGSTMGQDMGYPATLKVFQDDIEKPRKEP